MLHYFYYSYMCVHIYRTTKFSAYIYKLYGRYTIKIIYALESQEICGNCRKEIMVIFSRGKKTFQRLKILSTVMPYVFFPLLKTT